MERFKPRYLQVSDFIFKRMLSDAIENGSQLVACLNTPEKLRRVRQVTEIMNDLKFKDLQDKLAKEYQHMSLHDKYWSEKIKASFAKKNNVRRIYKPSKTSIEQR